MHPTLANGAFSTELTWTRMQNGGWRFDAGLAAVLQDLIAGRRAFDFGAGVGLYCRALGCAGIDGIPEIDRLTGGLVGYGDLTDPRLWIPPHQVAVCLEVAEHIPRSGERVFLDHLTRQADWLVLSWAPPGQPGVGHVNCRSPAEVCEQLRERGFSPDAAWTRRLRAGASISWFRRNLIAMQRLTGEDTGTEIGGPVHS